MLFTTGHANCNRHQITDHLRAHDIETLVDVRSFPGSRRNTEVNKETMSVWLPNAGIEYRHELALGGRRKPPKQRIPEDGWWRIESFANYAAHTRTSEFNDVYRDLLAFSDDHDVAIMCGEPCWWRCHRRMISDLATIDGREVRHIMPNGSLSLHKASEWAQMARSGVVDENELLDLQLF